MYQQKATQLALLQMTNPNFERNNGKKYKMRTLTQIGRSYEQRVVVMQQVMHTI